MPSTNRFRFFPGPSGFRSFRVPGRDPCFIGIIIEVDLLPVFLRGYRNMKYRHSRSIRLMGSTRSYASSIPFPSPQSQLCFSMTFRMK